MDVYQGKIGTVSPAIGVYNMNVYMNIDKEPTVAPGATGIGATGVEGTGTLQPVKWDIGYTGIDGANFTNLKQGF